ncbi:response regulator transcription factor [Bacillus sp. RO3]|nr:response regulator transcription factor [Bacillus sp. RO3]
MTSFLRVGIAFSPSLFSYSLASAVNKDPEIKVSAVIHTKETIIEQLKKKSIDMYLMDLDHINLEDYKDVTHLIHTDPHAKLIFLGSCQKKSICLRALELGCNGIIHKKMDLEVIVDMLKAVKEDHVLIPKELIDYMIMKSFMIDQKDSGHKVNIPPELNFTQREKEIAEYLLNGLDNSDISLHLNLSHGTVKNYISKIYDKLNVKNRKDALNVLRKYL